MRPREQGIRSIWPGRRAILGVVHLLPLPGAPRWTGSMDDVVDRAVRDAVALREAGFDGIVVENFSDTPFFAGEVPPETVAALTRGVLAVRDAVFDLPVGVNVLRNDAAAAVAIAAATGAAFVRVNVHTGAMWTDQGIVEGRAALTMRSRARLAPDLAVLADVHVKHATPPPGAHLGDVARDTWHRGLADALLVSGAGTGAPTDVRDLKAVREAVPGATVLVGSGLAPSNAATLLEHADGAIVGSSIMEGGRAGHAVDRERARALIAAVRELS